MPSPVKTAVSCPPSLLSQGRRYLWGMSSIQVTVPIIVFWGHQPPSPDGLTTGLVGAGLARYVYYMGPPQEAHYWRDSGKLGCLKT